jgi:hypothetical protein
MTLPASGPLAISDINTEIGQAPTYSSSLSFLNGLLKSPPASPNMSAFYSKAYYQSNKDGNCNNGNCSESGGPNGNCADNCNCGNINCSNCIITGPSDCSNCSNCNAINCANCDSQPYLQGDCNCACSYNCTQNAPSYNCTAASTSYACACACWICACACW